MSKFFLIFLSADNQWVPQSPRYSPSDFSSDDESSEESSVEEEQESQDVRRVVLRDEPMDLSTNSNRPTYTPILSSLLTTQCTRPSPVRPVAQYPAVSSSGSTVTTTTAPTIQGPCTLVPSPESAFERVSAREELEEGEISSGPEYDHEVMGSTEAVAGSSNSSPSPIGNTSWQPLLSQWKFASKCKSKFLNCFIICYYNLNVNNVTQNIFLFFSCYSASGEYQS